MSAKNNENQNRRNQNNRRQNNRTQNTRNQNGRNQNNGNQNARNRNNGTQNSRTQNARSQNNRNQNNRNHPGRSQNRAPERRVAQNPRQTRNAKTRKKVNPTILVASLSLVCILAIALGVYLYYGYQHKEEFFKGTTINGIDVGGMTVEEVETMLAEKTNNYDLVVTAKDGQTAEITAKDIDYHYVSDGSVQKIFDKQIWWLWVKGYIGDKRDSHEASAGVAYDKDALKNIMNSWSFMIKENQTAPVDAALSYVENQYVVTEHTDGNTIDETLMFDALVAAVNNSKKELNIEEAGAYVLPAVTSDDEVLNDNAKTLNEQINCTIVHNMPDGTTKVLNPETLRSWMSTDENGRYYRDDTVFNEKIAAYVQELNAAIEANNGSTVTFTSCNPSNPRQISIKNYTGGKWTLDVEQETTQLTNEIFTNASATREPIYSSRKFQGNGALGSTYVEIDMSAQHLWYFEGNQLMLECDIVSGTYTNSNRRTPEGIYSVDYKQEDRVLRGEMVETVTEVQVPVEVTVPGTDPVLDEYGNVIQDGTPPTTTIQYKTETKVEQKPEYETPVNYWMPFNGGIGMHDASWRGSFGGTIYKYSGSHGCINMPLSKAGELYSMIETGCTVVCYY